VTELCDGETLAELLEKYAEAGEFVPEVFVWKIFESLVSAVSFLHRGPSLGSDTWDPIFHRDIIPSNCFCTSRPTDEKFSTSSQIYPSITLGDFGCALRQTEVKAMSLNPKYPYSKEVPLMETSYDPPEGSYGTEAVDTYQIGLLLSEFILVDTFPAQSNIEYSLQWRRLIYQCRECDPKMRPAAPSLLRTIRGRGAASGFAGKAGIC
jgi:serine/threonine protein kinase